MQWSGFAVQLAGQKSGHDSDKTARCQRFRNCAAKRPPFPEGEMDSIHSFGDWLRRRRKSLDLTQGELAQRVSCSVDLIQKIEADARRPSKQLAERLAERLE